MNDLRVNAEQAYQEFKSQFPDASMLAIAMGETTKSHVAYTSPGVEVVENDTSVVFQHHRNEPFELLILHGTINGDGVSVGNQDHDYVRTTVPAGEQFRFYRQVETTPGTGILRQLDD